MGLGRGWSYGCVVCSFGLCSGIRLLKSEFRDVKSTAIYGLVVLEKDAMLLCMGIQICHG